MPLKHQTECYRTFDSVRWPNLCDLVDLQHEHAADHLKAEGYRIRVRKHRDGYRQAFVHPNDFDAAIAYFESLYEGRG